MKINNFSLPKYKTINSNSIKNFLSKYFIAIVFLLMILAGSLLSPYFLTLTNFRNVALQLSMAVIIAIGMLFTVISGGIDLSVGSVVALAGCMAAGFTQQGMSPVMVLFSVSLLMAGAGSVSGLLVSKGKVAPFIATLATMTIWRGAAYIYQVGQDRRIDGTKFVNIITGNIGPIPVPVIIMALVALVAGFVLTKTAFGRSIYAVGGNKEAARLSGINIGLSLTLVYVISSVLSGLSGMILTARLALGTALVGQGYELDAIAAVVIGGASMNGGTGTVVNTILGALIIGFLNNILNLMGVAAYPQMIIKGVIIVAAVILKRSNR
jgi:ribose transport system permease protein